MRGFFNYTYIHKNKMKKTVIYTIGHSTHQLDIFLDLLKRYAINCIIDVRSVAASRFNPQYNKKTFSDFLKTNNVAYLHFAEEFGARQTDPNLLDDKGKVDFEKVRQSKLFRQGINRIRQGLDKGYTITLMCSESEPLDCHRFSMISYALAKDGFEVNHILKDKTIISNAQLENRMLQKYINKLPKSDMFTSPIDLEERLKVAYRLRNQEIAFSPSGEN